MFETRVPLAGQKRKRSPSRNILPTPQPVHPYLIGNFAPIHQTVPLTPCTYEGTIPDELADGEYVRNGSNPVSNEDLGRDAHWFDGDGMLSGVSFRKDESSGKIEPEFVNQFVLTDLYLNTLSSPRLRVPILPSIATLVNPLANVFYVMLRILRTVMLVLLSHLPGSKQKIKKISVANTHVLYHDGRALATCESGPPMRIQLPGLETVGWFNGAWAEGDTKQQKADAKEEKVLGEGAGMLQWMREWTTAHPKIDPKTNEMLMFHASFAPPYVQYTILPQTLHTSMATQPQQKLLNAPVPGIGGGKMMHDFGVSLSHTVILDLPLTLDPMNQLKGRPPLTYDTGKPSRFGVFPRWSPNLVTWFETDAACIFHTANTWDDVDVTGQTRAVNMLVCRLTSAITIYASGNIAPPMEKEKSVTKAKRRMSFFAKYKKGADQSIWEQTPLLESPSEEKEGFIVSDMSEETDLDDYLYDEDQCRLYYYQFDLPSPNASGTKNQPGRITQQWALSALPFEFPSVRPDVEMQHARYIYGCSTTTKLSFGAALGKAAKIDALVKIDAQTLIARGKANPPTSVTGVVDSRTMADVLQSEDPDDPIQVFHLPEGWHAQEARFVPASSNTSEDDGYLLFYAFDESQANPTTGELAPDNSPLRAKSELWIINAKNMKDIVARVKLPQRVPYGLHGTWFSADQIREQRPVDSIRTTAQALSQKETGLWMAVRDRIEKMLS